MKWKQTVPLCHSIQDVIERNTGLPIQTFLSPSWSPIMHLDDVAARLRDLAAQQKPRRDGMYGYSSSII